MNTLKNNDFCFDSLEFLSSISDFTNSLTKELKGLSLGNYLEVFRNSSNAIGRTRKRIESFIEKWEEDDAKICSTLKTIYQYYGYYCDTLDKSTPTVFRCDARYISDSLNTSRMAIECRIKAIREFLNKNNRIYGI